MAENLKVTRGGTDTPILGSSKSRNDGFPPDFWLRKNGVRNGFGSSKLLRGTPRTKGGLTRAPLCNFFLPPGRGGCCEVEIGAEKVQKMVQIACPLSSRGFGSPGKIWWISDFILAENSSMRDDFPVELGRNSPKLFRLPGFSCPEQAKRPLSPKKMAKLALGRPESPTKPRGF